MKISIPAGTLFCFSSGEYSDYGMIGHFVALENIADDDSKKVKEEAEAEYTAHEAIVDEWRTTRDGAYPGSLDKQELFIAHMIRTGKIVSINCLEKHLGSYGEIDL